MYLPTLMVLLATLPAGSPPPPPPRLSIALPLPAASDDPMIGCVAKRLAPFVSPYGIQQAWPVMASPPPELLHALGAPLSDMGLIADGYQQFLHIDKRVRAVYVIEQGGFAGTTRVYGPLPLPSCKPGPVTTASPP